MDRFSAGGARRRDAAPEAPERAALGEIVRTLRALLKFDRKDKTRVRLAFCAILLASGAALAAPDGLRALVDGIERGLRGAMEISDLGRAAARLAVLYGFCALMAHAQGFLMAGVAQRLTAALRGALFLKIQAMPFRALDALRFGDLLSCMTTDADMIGQAVNRSLGALASAALLLLGSVVLMVWSDGVLALAALAVSLAGFVFMRAIGERTFFAFEMQQDALGELSGFVEERYSGHDAVLSYGMGEIDRQAFARHNERLAQGMLHAQRGAGLLPPVMALVGNMSYIAVFALAVGRGASFGTIVAFMAYIRLLTQTLSQIAQEMPALHAATAAGRRVLSFLRMAEIPAQAQTERPPAGEIVFDHVTFGYRPGSPVVRDVCFTVSPGQFVAVVGHTGAGKTTLINLLLRFYEPDAGEIRVGGAPIGEISPDSLRALFAVVPQEVWLMEGSIRDNLALGRPDVSDESVRAACERVGASHWIEAMPDAYDARLTGAEELSRGQARQLAVARAMLADAPYLLLDEATGAMDARVARRIHREIARLAGERTTFMVAHRLESVRDADMILVMERGALAQWGVHSRLIREDGPYRALYEARS